MDPRRRGGRDATPRRRGLLAAAGLLVVVLILALTVGGGARRRLVPGGGDASSSYDPLAFHPDRAAAMSAAAAAGVSHVIYAKSPGGVIASARRTAAYRPLIEAAAAHGPIDANTLEAIIMLESAGRADVVAGPDPSAAAGLTQIVASTATGLLGMHVDLAASRRLATQISSIRRTGGRRRLARLLGARAHADQRFDQRAALAGTERYLATARQRFGRDDLAVESYHMGIGNLEHVLRVFTGGSSVTPAAQLARENSLSYALVYFDSTPLRHPAAWRLLSGFGDDSSTYLWRVLGAREIMRLYRSDPAGLARLASLHGTGASAEHVLRPPGTPLFADPGAIAAARFSGELVAVPTGASAMKLGLAPAGALGLRRPALSTAVYLATGVRAIGHDPAPLQMTAATTDTPTLTASHDARSDHDPLHASGYAFDVARRYAGPAQAEAVQFLLDRLQALNVIAWQRHARIIHVVVGPGAAALGTLTAAG